jgi:hypothetical protein
MNRHSCPSGGAVFGFDATAVRLDYGLGDGESQPGTSLLARSGFIHAVEALEYVRQVLFGNAGSEGLLRIGTSPRDVPRAGHGLLPAQTSRGEEAPQAVIALARRRVNVLWAMLRDGTFHEDRARLAA